jgi:hypothetical protein
MHHRFVIGQQGFEVSRREFHRGGQPVADLVLKDIKQGNGVFPGKNAFIERT